MKILNKEKIYIAITTSPTKELASEIARTLVSENLAACVQVDSSGMESHYIWKDKQYCDKEYIIRMKIARKNLKIAELRLKELHTYECPQWYAIELDHISKDYEAWLLGISKLVNI